MPDGSAQGLSSMWSGCAVCSSRGSARRWRGPPCDTRRARRRRGPPCDMRRVRQSRREEPTRSASNVCSVSRGTAAALGRRCDVRRLRESHIEEPNKSAQEDVQRCGESSSSRGSARRWRGPPCDVRRVRQSRREEPARSAAKVCSVSRGTAAAHGRHCDVRCVRESHIEEPNKSAQEDVQRSGDSSDKTCHYSVA